MIRSLRHAVIALAMACPASCLLGQAVVTPPPSTAITNFAEESQPSVQMTYPSKTQIGDLWPSCWSDDGNLYAANGDGTAFNGKPNTKTPVYDMAISRITGNPAASPAIPLVGTTVSFEVEPSYTTPASANNAIGVNYTGDNKRFNDKPTGMLCVGGDIYLAYQNLGTSAANFTGAPAATILRSRDHGQTWSAPPEQPMFGSANPNTPGLFTTIFFLDMGQDTRRRTRVHLRLRARHQLDRPDQALPRPHPLRRQRLSHAQPPAPKRPVAVFQRYAGRQTHLACSRQQQGARPYRHARSLQDHHHLGCTRVLLPVRQRDAGQRNRHRTGRGHVRRTAQALSLQHLVLRDARVLRRAAPLGPVDPHRHWRHRWRSGRRLERLRRPSVARQSRPVRHHHPVQIHQP